MTQRESAANRQTRATTSPCHSERSPSLCHSEWSLRNEESRSFCPHDFRRDSGIVKKNGGGRDDRLRVIRTKLRCDYGVALAGFASLNFKLNAATPAATFKPFCPSIETGCNAIELLKPPTNTFAPAPTPTAALAVAPP